METQKPKRPTIEQTRERVPASTKLDPRVCPGCGRIMSWREAAEQGACNDCSGGAFDPSPLKELL